MSDTRHKAWVDLPVDDVRQMLIGLIGLDFGPTPETRIPEIRDSRREFADSVADQCRVGANDVVLDLGSGCGFGTYWFAQRAKHVQACDISPAYLQFAAAECASLDNVSFHQIEPRRLDVLDDRSVDAVCAMSVFIHLNLYDIYWYFSELARVVTPGGRVWMDVADSEALDLSAPNVLGGYFLAHAAEYRSDAAALPGLMQWNSVASVVHVAAHHGFDELNRESGGQLLFAKQT